MFQNPEDQILTSCALRFDGYKYVEKTAFDYQRALKKALKTGKLPSRSLQKLTLFFILHRMLYKHDGGSLDRNDSHWKLFRELFFELCDIPIPDEYLYRGDDIYERQWRRILAADGLPKVRALMEKIHCQTLYR